MQSRRKEIFHVSARQILALEIDYDNQNGIKQEDNSHNTWNKKSFFVLDSNFMLYHFERFPENPVFTKKIYSMHHHELSHIKIKPWTSAFLTTRVITLNNSNYSVESTSHWDNI